MSWDALAASAELIGAVAVVVTLIYLSLQIRNQNRVTAAQIHQQRADSVTQLASTIGNDEASLALFEMVTQPGFKASDLCNSELFRARVLFSPVRANLENTFEQYKYGFLSEEFYRDVAVSNCRSYGPAIISLGLPITTSFREELEKILADQAT